MPWFRRGDGSFGSGEDKDKLDDVEFKPDEFKKDLTEYFKTQLTELQTANDAKMKPLLDMAANLEADRAARAKAADDANKKKTTEDNQVTEEDFLLDPIDATRRLQQPVNNAVMSLASRQARREILEDKEFYHGDIKTKVDAFIDAQPLQNRIDPNVITNAYKLVVFDHQKDIADGKIKARNTSLIFESGSTGGHGGKEHTDDTGSLTDEEKRTAKIFNMSEADWKKSRAELTFV